MDFDSPARLFRPRLSTCFRTPTLPAPWKVDTQLNFLGPKWFGHRRSSFPWRYLYLRPIAWPFSWVVPQGLLAFVVDGPTVDRPSEVVHHLSMLSTIQLPLLVPHDAPHVVGPVRPCWTFHGRHTAFEDLRVPPW